MNDEFIPSNLFVRIDVFMDVSSLNCELLSATSLDMLLNFVSLFRVLSLDLHVV